MYSGRREARNCRRSRLGEGPKARASSAQGNALGWEDGRTSPSPVPTTYAASESPATITTAALTAGCASNAASISPGSIRKPRSLICWSSRPRYSIRPSGRKRARSPVR